MQGKGNKVWNFFFGWSAKSLTPQQKYRNRQALLAKVKNFWVKGVLEKSLYKQVLIELGLEERQDAIENPLNKIIETEDSSPQPLPEGTKVIDIFDEIGAGRTLLILGEPGSGKTTTLLELTRDLVARAEQNCNLPIPVVLNLSSWASKRQKIADWLVEELGTKYQVHKEIRESLVKKQPLLPLLDGLDEVKEEYRNNCIVALNQFKQDYDTELVVCSRIRDYEKLSNPLKFQSAVYLKPLSLEQIGYYLHSLGTELTGLKTLLQGDTVWQDLAQSPLMLNIMTLTYHKVEDLPKTEVVDERELRNQLFNDYIEKMFKRGNRSKINEIYSKEQTLHWLIWLAQKMMQEPQGIILIGQVEQEVFLIEQIQPTLLNSLLQKFIYSTGIGSIHVLVSGISIGLSIWWSYGWLIALITGVVIGIAFGLSVWLIIGLRIDLIIEKIISAIFKLMNKLRYGENFYGENFEQGSTNKQTKTPNQGIKESAKRAFRFGMVGAIIGAIVMGIMIIMGIAPSEMLLLGIFFGLAYGSTTQGLDCIKHFALRLTLYFNNYIPWNYARFLDYAAKRIFLQKVGGGYMFIHRMLMEHFAQMQSER